MRIRVTMLAALCLLGGCATTGTPAPVSLSGATQPSGGPLLDRLIGQTAASLTASLGQPLSDVREGSARKLQFGNATCVLDAYLYPRAKSEPVVTYIDARQTDGSPIDRASCVGALQVGRKK